MLNNDVLRRLRYVLNLSDTQMIKIFALSGVNISQEKLIGIMKKEDEQDVVACIDVILIAFLDGLIIDRRGMRDQQSNKQEKKSEVLTNNLILKKLRIALELREEIMHEIMQAANVKISRSELSAFFRKKEHKNYMKCGDQFLRNFLNGLAKKMRK
ncbi:DUF1456 family protein [bacterium]|nr:DUF1456 family protein [bacterium]